MKKFIFNKSTDAYKAGFNINFYDGKKNVCKLKSAWEPEFLFSQNESLMTTS